MSCLCGFLLTGGWRVPIRQKGRRSGWSVAPGATCCLAATGRPSTQALYEAAIGILIVDFLLWDAEGCRPGECWLGASFVTPEHNVQLW